jgi:hypothetical protein
MKTKMIDINKRHVIESIHDSPIIVVEFTQEQEIYPEEEYVGMDAYECYILDNNYESYIRAVYYKYTNGAQYLKYKESQDSEIVTIYIERMLPIEDGETIEEALNKEPEDPHAGLSMGDIC